MSAEARLEIVSQPEGRREELSQSDSTISKKSTLGASGLAGKFEISLRGSQGWKQTDDMSCGSLGNMSSPDVDEAVQCEVSFSVSF